MDSTQKAIPHSHSSHRGRLSRRSHGSFTLIELLIVVAILSILANLAIPSMQMALNRTRALAIISDFKAIESAATTFHSDNGRWPNRGQNGKEPPELSRYLKGEIGWNENGIIYRWQAAKKKAGWPCSIGVGAGLTVKTRDEVLRMMIEERWDRPLYKNRNQIMFIIEPCSR
ncbi:MAG: type II secretion system GspH family protein [Thermoanaerobaculia bacterium]|nr:type II secretion system GspH family protein [Thermoanaerobaculia bacterium]